MFGDSCPNIGVYKTDLIDFEITGEHEALPTKTSKQEKLSKKFRSILVQRNYQGTHKVGVLEKRGNKNHRFRNWRKRFFAVQNFTLYYFEDSSEEANLKGCVDLRCCYFEECKDPIDGRPYCFELERAEDRWSIYIDCKRKDILDDWLNTIREVQSRHRTFISCASQPDEFKTSSVHCGPPSKVVGVFTSIDGQRYWGGVNDLQRSGHGILLLPNGNTITADWSFDNVKGLGILECPDQNWKYEGAFEQCKPHGRGKLYLNTGVVWECNWENGSVVACSDGIQTKKETGEVYEGSVGPSAASFSLPCRRGHGKLLMANGDTLEGCFDETTGEILSGSRAQYKCWATGNEYYGQIKDSLPAGEGKMLFHSENKEGMQSFEGNFAEGHPHGWGLLHYKGDENTYELQFDMGKLVQKGGLFAGCIRTSRLENKRLRDFLQQEKCNLISTRRGNVCYLCNHEMIDVILLSCLHQRICNKCAQFVSRCPECKKDIKGVIKKFLN